jgi:D-amino-acid dehydrogenase
LRVVVVGGGVVGLSCAYELERAGAEVTVVERDRCGGATSLGNAGWVVPSISIPMPAPGVTARALKMLFKHDGSLRLRPRLDPDFLRWCWRFWRSSSRERHEAGLEALMKLNQQTIQLYRDLRASGVEFEMHESGLLIAALSEETLQEYGELLETARTAGYAGEVQLLGKEALLGMEPALSDAVAGAVYAKDDLHVRPDTLVSGLASYLAARGVRILEHAEVRALEPVGKGTWQVFTSREELAAGRIVIAAGMWSSGLLAKLGVRIPLESGKGYSVTAGGRGTKPRHAIKLAEPNVACSPFEDAVRISGVFELGGRGSAVDRRLLQGVLRSASVFLRDWVMEEPRFEWAGMRPTTPDDLPLIGAVPGFEHLYVATGHGMLGVTLAPATGAALAPLVLEDRIVPEIEPFSLDRFASNSRRQAPEKT